MTDHENGRRGHDDLTDEFGADDFDAEDFSREEALFREAFARHAGDLDDELVEFEGSRRESGRRAVTWLAVAASVITAAGGTTAWLNRTQQAVPGPAAVSATPSRTTPTPTPSVSATTVPSPSSSPNASSSAPRPTASGGMLTPVPSMTVTPTREATPVETPAAGARPSGPARATGSSQPSSAPPAAEESELGDYNPNDPVPAKKDQLTIETPITFGGWGAYELGTTADELKQRNLIVEVDDVCEGSLEAITAHKTVGLAVTQFAGRNGPLDAIVIRNPMVRTDRGAGYGMTLAEVEKLYGSQFAYEEKVNDYGPPFVMGRAKQGGREILFLVDDGKGDYAKATPQSTVDAMVVRPYANSAPFMDAC
ncbi:hypothetical protein ACTQ49_06550 [Luteococcus sp. Sow4_B9]|uniref:hypothetical protein n=1 Tax=Luteococcus sp. Sow4_B9 TaxID=3438792 RepID=UPI003F99AE2D